MSTNVINYQPPSIVKAYIKRYLPDELFYTWIVGPFGSAKTTGMFFKLVYMAGLQAKSPDGIRYSRAVVVRNTFPQLRDNTLVSWNYWFQDGIAGEWKASENKFTLRWGDVECEVLFRALDTPADVARVLGLEVTFALIDEFVEIPRKIIESLSGRLGRYKPPGDVGCTNYGMWGASNPGTEDNWWFDYCHGKLDVETGVWNGCAQVKFPTNDTAQAAYDAFEHVPEDISAWYYHQPSGTAPDAENIEHLPRGYYKNLAKGKSKEWIKQFIEAEWGFSIGGTAVVKTFRPELHIAPGELRFNRHLRLIVGLDPGLTGSAMIFMQQDLFGRILVLGELVQSGYGAKRLIKERLRPYVRERFPDARLMFAPDPAAANRSANDEKTIVATFREEFGNESVKIETNNRLPLRMNAIDHYCSTLVEGGPALLIDPVHCPVLIRALRGGWRFAMDLKKDQMKDADPEKNAWSHPGDAFGYGLRYFHKGVMRDDRTGGRPFVPPPPYANSYHVR